MRIAIVIVASLLLASGCEDILPVETVDLCEQPDPPSAECPQCDSEPFARDCPQCRADAPAAGCENAPAGTSGADGGSTGAAAGAGSGARAGAGAGAGGRSGAGGGGAGRAGSGGSREDAGACAACPEATPMCFAGSECVQCVDHEDCAARCEPESHTCVECLGDDDCGDTTPRCDSGPHECVECLTNADCDADEPVCGDNRRCGPCAGNEDCAERADTQFCDTDADSARAGECVECLGHGHCQNPEPQCNGGDCAPCTGDEACATRDPDARVCNTRQGADTFGQCVECTLATQTAKCGDNACKLSTGVCTDVERGSLIACKRCEADAECNGATRCVPFEFDGHDLGHFCFFVDQNEDGPAHCADYDSARRPYNQLTPLTSIDGVEGGFCLPITTCKAVDDATGGTPRSCTDNSLCGEPDINDGYCPDSGPAMDKCSYACQGHADCPVSGATSCNGPVGLKFCQAP